MPVRRLPRPLGAAVGLFLAAAVAVGQQPGGNDSRSPIVRGGGLTPDQVKRLLAPGAPDGGLPPDMLDLLRQHFEQDSKGVSPEQVDKAGRAILQNKGLMEQLRKYAEERAKAKDQGKQGPTRLPPDLDRWLKDNPPGKGGPGPGVPPPNVPPVPGGQQPPVPQPPQPGGQLDPRTLPPIGPQPNGGRVPPDGGFGQPQILPPDGGARPPATPPAGAGPSLLPTDDLSPKARAMEGVAGFWERNVGPLDETPAVKQFLFDVVEGAADLEGPDGKSFWESFGREAGDGKSFADFFEGIDLDGAGDGWSWPKLDLPDMNFGGGDGPHVPEPPRENWFTRNFGAGSRSPASATSGGRGGLGIDLGVPGMEGSWLPVVLLGAVLLAGLIWWRFWYLADERAAAPAGVGGLGPWPVDPRRLLTREDVTRAFEYLSVLVCGPAAKTWTHNTIARALLDLVDTRPEAAVMLARLYELARYTPADEPLTTAELAEARRLVCRLAGLDAE